MEQGQHILRFFSIGLSLNNGEINTLGFFNMHRIHAKSRAQAGLFCIYNHFAPNAPKLPWL